MRTQLHEASAEGLRLLNNSEDIFTDKNPVETGAYIDLQDEYIEHRRAILKELHIQDRTDALKDPKAYFELIAWEFMERCYDRIVWSRARPGNNGEGFYETAHCAVFSSEKQTRFPAFLAKITFHTVLDAEGGIRIDENGKPCMQPSAYILESALSATTMKPHAVYRFKYESGRDISVEETEFMGLTVQHDLADPETGGTDPLKVASWLDRLSTDTLKAIRGLEDQNEEQRSISDRLAYLATHHIMNDNQF